MIYETDAGFIDIPDAEIIALRQSLNLNTTQAIALWLSDHADELKPQNSKGVAFAALIQGIAALSENIDIIKDNRTFTFSLGDDNYEVTLVKKRKSTK